MQKSARDEQPPGGAGWWREWPWAWEDVDDAPGAAPGGVAPPPRARARRLLSAREAHRLALGRAPRPAGVGARERGV